MIRAVYEKKRDRFIRYAAGCLRNTGQMGIHLEMEADDLVHESVLLALEGKWPPSVVRRMSLEGWTLDRSIIAVRSIRCAALAKRESRRAWITRTNDATDLRKSLVNPVDADAEAKTVLLKTRVRAAVEVLPPMQRQAVEQLDLRDRPIREVSEETGRAEKTLRNHRGRARQRLCRVLATHRANPLA
jgi:DNA-directed RNA polymerase specialized sigma24 family protein